MRAAWSTALLLTLAGSARAWVADAVATATAPAGTQEPCAAVASSVQGFLASTATGSPYVPNSLALACLESVPVDVATDIAFIDYVEPYIEFQSTLAYLKNPPVGYTLPGVDVLGGLAQIRDNLSNGKYTQQWAFEKDLYTLINVLPHDFHFNLLPPLVELFLFRVDKPLVSLSIDGSSIPQPYAYDDLVAYFATSGSNTSLSWTPSPIVEIDSEPVTDHLLLMAQQTSPFQDPDAFYNRLFYSVARASQGDVSDFTFSANLFGFSNEYVNFTFANGTESSSPVYASTNFNFEGVIDGPSLYQAREVPTNTTTTPSPSTTSTPAPSTTTSTPAVTSLNGYPSPIVMHPQGYTAGYFLEDDETAVLVMNAFSDPAEDIKGNPLQQSVIKQFLAACRQNNKKKLIVDLSGNGGGSVFNGIDAFKQLFPSVQPFGATRYRFTEAMNFFGTIYTAADVHNMSFSTVYQIQGSLDINGRHFDNWKELAGPDQIYGDEFTNLIREDMSDALLQLGSGFVVSGYLNNTKIAPQAFAAENIVLLHDGSCGSTCAIFSELMKSQGNVRSVSVGGRPKTGPMQGVGGSKGAQVLSYPEIQVLTSYIPFAAFEYAQKNLTFPATPNFNLTTSPPPLKMKMANGRFNLRNNYHDSNDRDFPLQFVYEATNCRLYYQPADFFSQNSVWNRVANVTWGTGFCVDGSTTTSNGSMPSGAYDTVSFSVDAMSNVTLPPTIGLVIKSGDSNVTSKANGTRPSSTPVPVVTTNDAADTSLMSSTGLALFVVAGAMFAVL